MTLAAGTGMVFHGSLAVEIKMLPQMPEDNLLALANESSELLLKTVLAADERREVDESEELVQELKRQDLKISMILELLSTLLQQQNLLPALQELKFTTGLFSIRQTRPRPVGSLYQLGVYVDARMPRPVNLYGFAEAGAETGWQNFRLAGMSQCLQDALDKFIFRQHRRLVAAKLRKPEVVPASQIKLP